MSNNKVHLWYFHNKNVVEIIHDKNTSNIYSRDALHVRIIQFSIFRSWDFSIIDKYDKVDH